MNIQIQSINSASTRNSGSPFSDLLSHFLFSFFRTSGPNFESLAGISDVQLFIYLAWHNTHTPLECPEEWMFPPVAAWNKNNSQRNTYNCMARVLDDGIGNVTKALRTAQLWE